MTIAPPRNFRAILTNNSDRLFYRNPCPVDKLNEEIGDRGVGEVWEVWEVWGVM
ncbi:MAG: hypothetical protein NHB32_12535 [Fischerella sp. CENA71]|nr:hypothetical protein [Fischerella sp. CENA71]